MRTIIEIPEAQLQALARLSQARKVSRAELIRQAVDGYLQLNASGSEAAFGLWRKSGRRQDGQALQAKLRAEWDR